MLIPIHKRNNVGSVQQHKIHITHYVHFFNNNNTNKNTCLVKYFASKELQYNAIHRSK